jgi:hypothetical protein
MITNYPQAAETVPKPVRAQGEDLVERPGVLHVIRDRAQA